MDDKAYIIIDMKSFYASCECVARGLPAMTTDLVVADPERGKGTICLAVSPSLKAKGIKNRCRVHEIPACFKYIVAPPRMQMYIDYAAEIYGIFLDYFCKDDIFVYSIDESFIDVTPYLTLYKKTPHAGRPFACRNFLCYTVVIMFPVMGGACILLFEVNSNVEELFCLVPFLVIMSFAATALAAPTDKSADPAFRDIDRSALIKRAFEVQPKSYAPYSNFNVAAAVLCGSGKIYTGVNVENASYPAGICAERNAIFHAAAEGERQIKAIAIIGGPKGVVSDYCSPCGVCRQVMREFGDPKKVLVIMAKSPTDYQEMTLEELLPLSFGPESLN